MSGHVRESGLVTVAALVLQRAMRDVAEGLRRGWLNERLRYVATPSATVNACKHDSGVSPADAAGAAYFFRSREAMRFCEVLNFALARAQFHPDFFVRRARVLARDPRAYLLTDETRLAKLRTGAREWRRKAIEMGLSSDGRKLDLVPGMRAADDRALASAPTTADGALASAPTGETEA